jgi:hypothetical protein
LLTNCVISFTLTFVFKRKGQKQIKHCGALSQPIWLRIIFAVSISFREKAAVQM